MFFRNNHGFTLIEVLVASALLILMMTGALVAMNNNLRVATRIRQQLVATNLVQEGLELVRNLRDEDWFFGSPFGTSIPAGIWRLDWDDAVLTDASAINPTLKKDSAVGIFSYDSPEETIFTRTIIIIDEPDGHKRVEVDVSWPASTGGKSVNAELHLFDWR